jgi:hypothetical protein
MASIPQSVAARPVPGVVRRGGLLDRYFYLTMALVQAGFVVWGFSHTVRDNLLQARPPRPGLLWVHGMVFSSWMVFYILQIMLVRVRNVKVHRTLGWFGVGLATCMVVLGVVISFVMGHFHATALHDPGSVPFEIVGIWDMASFGACVAFAIRWRRRPELHRRLMFVATCCLLSAAFGRIDFVFNHNLFYACLDGLILLGASRDLAIDHSVSVVYRWALPMLAVGQWCVVQMYARPVAWWAALAHRMMG